MEIVEPVPRKTTRGKKHSKDKLENKTEKKQRGNFPKAEKRQTIFPGW